MALKRKKILRTELADKKNLRTKNFAKNPRKARILKNNNLKENYKPQLYVDPLSVNRSPHVQEEFHVA